jgi:uncharacterized protein (TIGR02145 family)
MEPLLANMDAFKQTLDDTQESADVKSTLESFNNYFENATIDEQTQMAVMYTSNKTLFDAILLTNFSNPGDRITVSDILLITQHSGAVLLAAGGSVAALLGPTGVDRILGVAVAAVGFIKAAQTHIKLQQRNLDTLGLVFEGIIGELDRGGNELMFQDDTATTISLDLAEKKLTAEDAATATDDIAVYFKDFNRYNYYAAKINVIIQTLNNIPFVSFKPIPLEKMPENVQPVNTDVDQTIFNDITFSIEHPNLSLVSVSFLNSGQISMKIKIIGSPAVIPVTSKLKYTYKDDYTTFTGSFPIKVSNVQSSEVTIGAQVWSAKNLEVTTYSNGDMIPQVTDESQLEELTTGAWCYYDMDPSNNVVYGKLYNWYAVNDPRGLAPQGWHIPTMQEWETMESFLGDVEAGTKIKSTGVLFDGSGLWEGPNTGTNSTGFNALPGGAFQSINGWFSGKSTNAKWWTKSAFTETEAMYAYVVNSQTEIGMDWNAKFACMSVRCLKD